ncbi:hypothetical protein [Pelobacter seleniigenes]|uniref:hypothetical protein n=1 Tax=Pelobacter seleniigenes TaxID=407188 RepID=UPI0004A6B6C4|nr:hypothetical protein [Pelobacter seleniigenes]
MTDDKFFKSLSRLGFPMFEPNEELEVNETLAEAVKSNDTRIWEGFPVLLANAGESYQFASDQVEQRLPNKELKQRYHQLILLSAAVYTHYHLSFSWLNKLKKSFSDQDKTLVKSLRKGLAHRQTNSWPADVDPERVRGLFELYYEQKIEKDRRRKDRYEEFSLEYALSQLFSPKQKELFKKKLEGDALTKTEQEYYSRTVKKKVVALANSELHSLARKLLEQ